MSKILLKKNGAGFKPYTDIEEAEDVLNNLKIDGSVIDIDGGYAILKLSDRVPVKTEYFECSIPVRSSPEDLDVIPLGHNGHIINVRRGTQVILPSTHIGVAKDALRIDYEIKGSTIIPQSVISACPLMVGKKCSYAEYMKQMKDGNKQRDEDAKERLRRIRE